MGLKDFTGVTLHHSAHMCLIVHCGGVCTHFIRVGIICLKKNGGDAKVEMEIGVP